MTADSLLVYTIIVLVIGYSQLVSHTSELETLFSFVNKLGADSFHPAKSCRDIYNYNMASCGQSRYYWIKTDQVYRVYCDMQFTCGGITGGWMRIANYIILILLKEMTAPVDGKRLHNQGYYVEDLMMLLDVILLTSLITRLNIILSVVSYVDINWAALRRF